MGEEVTTYYCLSGLDIIGSVEADCYVCAGRLAKQLFPSTISIAITIEITGTLLYRDTCVMGRMLLAEEGFHGNPNLN